MPSYRITVHVDYKEDASKEHTFYGLGLFLRRRMERFCSHTELLSDEDDEIEVEKFFVESERIS